LLLAGMITGCSDSDSATATAPSPTASLSAPAEVTVAVADDTAATIAWTEVAGAVSYNLYRDVTPGVKKGSGTAVMIAGVTSPYSDQGLEYNTTYYYVVTAVFAAGESPESPEVSVNTAEAPLNPAVLDSAASFLAGATGKEDVMNVDQVVFINQVLWVNPLAPAPTLAAAGDGGGSGGGSGGSDSLVQKLLYSDLYVLLRDAYGVPILDENGCEMPIASSPIEIPVLDGEGNPVLDEDGNPVVTISTTVPMIVEEYMDGLVKCSVVEEYAIYTIPVEIGRLNMVRSSVQNPEVLTRGFEEAINNINAAESIEADLAGRLVMVSTQEVVDELGNITYETVRSTIDSPRENLALYRNLLFYGKLVGYGAESIGEEGQTIPAPWLEIRPDLPMGDLAYLRDGTPGRTYGVDLLPGNYVNFSLVSHSTKTDYFGKEVAYVQFYPDDPEGCLYKDETADAWLRVFDGSDEPLLTNIAGFTKHADDARRLIVFIHDIIQDVPDDGIEPVLPADILVWNTDHTTLVPEMMEANPTPQRHLLLEQAAAFLAGAAGKETPITVDATVFINTVLGINELDLTAIDKGALFGDLWVLLRDDNGVPVKDDNGCVMPLPSEPITMTIIDENGLPVVIPLETVPMMLEEYMDGLYKCTVVPGYEDYVIEVEIGRLNIVRAYLNNLGVLDRRLYEAVKNINTGIMVKRDLAGRLVYTTQVLDEAGLPVLDEFGAPVLEDKTIDSPLENLALYRALLKWGKLEGTVTIKLEEGVSTEVNVAIADTVDVYTHGMQFLKYGDETGQPLGVHPDSNYADFSSFNHLSKADYDGVPVDFVERVVDGTCAYQDVLGANLWTRVLGGEATLYSNIKGFAAQADDSRKTILFTHNIINDPLPVVE
jgi:hypothetical protein